jgi:hypothetical protein
VHFNGNAGLARNPQEARALGTHGVSAFPACFDITVAENVWPGLKQSPDARMRGDPRITAKVAEYG